MYALLNLLTNFHRHVLDLFIVFRSGGAQVLVRKPQFLSFARERRERTVWRFRGRANTVPSPRADGSWSRCSRREFSDTLFFAFSLYLLAPNFRTALNA